MKTFILFVSSVLVFASAAFAEPVGKTGNNTKTANHAFQSGEKLTYVVSWSKILKAGVAVMEVKEEEQNGTRIYRFVSSARSAGIVSTFYRVTDLAQSLVAADELCSLRFNLDSRHGKRKKHRELIFDQENHTVSQFANSMEGTYDVPPRVHDSLSSLYYLRTRTDFGGEKPIVIDVFENGKNWSVEVHIIGREKLQTVLGEVDTVKVKTQPKYDGVFQNKGEIVIWFTDDARKIPVLMKSTISIGSIVASLTEMKPGEEAK